MAYGGLELSEDWASKYRPASLKDVLGNPGPVKTLKEWSRFLDSGIRESQLFLSAVLIGKHPRHRRWLRHGLGYVEMNVRPRSRKRHRKHRPQRSHVQYFSEDGEYLDHQRAEETDCAGRTRTVFYARQDRCDARNSETDYGNKTARHSHSK